MILAMLLVLGMGMVQGCAPGDIKSYTAKAQQAGELIFEGKAVSAGKMGDKPAEEGETEPQEERSGESVEETEAEPQEEQSAESAEEASERSAQKSAGNWDLEAEALGIAINEPEADKEPDGAVSMAEMGIQIQRRTQGSDGEDFTAGEESAETDPEEGINAGEETAKETGAGKDSGKTEPQGLAAMAEKLSEEARSAMEEQAESFTGHLSGRDSFGEKEQEALQAVLEKRPYGEKTLCLANTVGTAKDSGSVFLLLFDREALTVRGKVQGDLWFYAGEEAELLSEGLPFGKVCGIQTGGEEFLLAETGKGKEAEAQVYRIREKCAGPCFTGAKSIAQTADGLCVTYASHFVHYEPIDGSWSGEGTLSCFYRWEGDRFTQQTVRELTAEQYLAYMQPDTEAEEELLWKEGQEEKFYAPQTGREELRYSFFAVGDGRVGYRECRIGRPLQEEEDALARDFNPAGERNVTVTYRYRITELESGVLSVSGKTYDGEGFYFADYDGREEELRVSPVPAPYGKNRIANQQNSLQPKGRAALERIRQVQPYSPEDVCFVQTADYDGDGKSESFVAVGGYDRFLGAPVCDLWFAAEKEPVLLAEGLPVKDCHIMQDGEKRWLLLSGYCAEGVTDRLYGVAGGEAVRYLENAFAIAAGENGGLQARLTGDAGARLRYYHFREGAMEEYGLQEKPVRTLLDYGNGNAVYRRLCRFSDRAEEGLSYLEQDNGLIHVTIAGRDGRTDYETYCVRDAMLVLVDSGEWTDSEKESVGQEN